MKSFIFTTAITVMFSVTVICQQNVAINNDGSDPHPLAILDVKKITANNAKSGHNKPFIQGTKCR